MARRLAILIATLSPQDWPSGERINAPVRYDLLREALIRFSNGLGASAAAKEARISRAEFYRIANKCVDVDNEGIQLGSRALLKYVQWTRLRRNDQQKLNAKKPVAGSFLLLLKKYPNIKSKVDKLALSGAGHEGKNIIFDVEVTAIFESFKALCQSEGLQNPQYPFNSNTEGRTSIRRYVAKKFGCKNNDESNV